MAMLIARRTAGVLATSLAAVVCLTACGGAQSRFESHMKRGNALFAAGDFTKASIEFRNALQIEPKSNAARLAAGHAAEKLKRPRDAYGLYQSVVDSAPDNLEARKDLARLLVYEGSPDQALKTLEPAFAKHPDDPVLLSLRAAARVRVKNVDGAIADADRALKVAPDNEDAIEVRAGLYKQAGDIASARALVQGALAKLPNDTNLHGILVDLALTAGDADQAEQQLNALIKLAPQEARYRYQLAILYSRTKKLDEAQRVLEDAAKALPKSDEPKLALVDFLTAQLTPAVAQQVLRDFIAHNPDDYDLRLGLGALLLHSGSTKEAVDTYNEIVRLDGTKPKGLIARDRLADIASAQGRDDEALKLIGQVLEKDARDSDALGRRAAILLSRGDSAGAIVDLRAVLRDRPQNVGVQRMLAQAYMANGQPALAEQALRAALDVAPKDPATRMQLAQVLVQTQRADEAVTLLEETVRLVPANVSARTELIRAYLNKRDFTAARTAAGDLKTLHPESAAGWYLAGMAATGQNMPDEAQKEFEHALSIQPRAYDTLTALARLEVARGQGAQAIALVKKAAEADPPSPPLFNLLGELYFGQNQLAQSDQVLTKANTMAPKWWLPYRNLALTKVAEKDHKSAVALLEAGLKLAPSELQLMTELALVYENDGRVNDAIALYEAAYRQNPHSQPIANNLAMLLVNYKEDRASLDRARDMTADFASSNDGKLLDTNGWVHIKRGEYAEALPVLDRAIDREPKSSEIRYHLGMAELYLGHTERARADLEAALAGSAKFYGSDAARSTLASLKGRASG
jgi:tetratricopeptide (TPR) repeat protein